MIFAQRRWFKMFLAGFFVFGFAHAVSASDVPLRINFQGKLLDPSTNLPKNGNQTMTFAIYDNSSAGNQLFTEGPLTVSVTNGVFSVQIGNTATLSPNV